MGKSRNIIIIIRIIVTETKNNVEKIMQRILRKKYNNRENTIMITNARMNCAKICLLKTA